jgi:hypothetical protein
LIQFLKNLNKLFPFELKFGRIELQLKIIEPQGGEKVLFKKCQKLLQTHMKISLLCLVMRDGFQKKDAVKLGAKQ